MSKTIDKMPAIHIDRKHQSAPKETDGDKAVRLAADEIEGGRWKLSKEQETEMDVVPGLALRDGITPDVKPWSQEDFDRTDQSLVIGQHPRVVEALARMEAEKSEATVSGQKYAELAAMMHETVEESRRLQRWDGQERWSEDDALEARKGKILTPLDFYTRLMTMGGRRPGGQSISCAHDRQRADSACAGCEEDAPRRQSRTGDPAGDGTQRLADSNAGAKGRGGRAGTSGHAAMAVWDRMDGDEV